MFVVGMVMGGGRAELIGSCTWIHWPFQGHGPHLQACGGLDRQRLVASQVDILGRLNLLHQYRLALLKPQGSKEEARQVITRATAFKKRILPGVRRSNMHGQAASQR